jgi:hypothetical protein
MRYWGTHPIDESSEGIFVNKQTSRPLLADPIANQASFVSKANFDRYYRFYNPPFFICKKKDVHRGCLFAIMHFLGVIYEDHTYVVIE